MGLYILKVQIQPLWMYTSTAKHRAAFASSADAMEEKKEEEKNCDCPGGRRILHPRYHAGMP